MVLANDLFYNIFSMDLTCVTSSGWTGYLLEASHITVLGNMLYSSYAIWIILTSTILLVAMVGCIVITLKEKTSNSSTSL